MDSEKNKNFLVSCKEVVSALEAFGGEVSLCVSGALVQLGPGILPACHQCSIFDSLPKI